MLVFFSWIGLGMMVLSFLLGLVIARVLQFPNNAVFFIAGFVMILVDLLYRNLTHKQSGVENYFRPKLGGQLMFIPVWIWGILSFLRGLMEGH